MGYCKIEYCSYYILLYFFQKIMCSIYIIYFILYDMINAFTNLLHHYVWKVIVMSVNEPLGSI